VIYVHGGAWTSGTKAWEVGDLVLPHVPEAGFSVLSIEYRLAPRHPYPAAIDDVRAAIRYIRQHAAQFRVDGGRMALAGASAGGHLVSLVGGTFCNVPGGLQACGLHGVISMAGVADLRSASGVPAVRMFLGPRLGVEGQRLLAEASPITHVDRGDPPVLLIHGDGDPRIPLRQSEQYLRSLQGAGVPSRLVVLPGGNHVANWGQIRSPNWQNEIVRFLNSYVNPRR
jgi:acetyl esterase/lipase